MKIRAYPTLFLLLFFSAYTLTACRAKTRLPAERPADFTLRYNSNAGMLPIAESLTLASNGSSYEYFYQGTTNHVDFEVSDQELDDLYQWLRENRFDRIESESEEVFDRGGESIGISWGTTSYSASNSGMEFIKDDWQDEWGNALAGVTDLMQRKVEEQRVNYTIMLDRSLADETVAIYFESEPVFTGVVEIPDDLDGITIPFRHLPGTGWIRVQVDSQALYQEFEVTIDEYWGVKIALKNGQLDFMPFIE